MNKINKRTKGASHNIEAVEATFFISNYNFSNKIEVVEKLTDGLSKMFDGDPAILPLPEDAPFELPRIILSSKDKSLTCSISYESIRYLVNVKLLKNGTKDLNLMFNKVTLRLANNIFKKLEWKVNRTAHISRYTYIPPQGATNFLKEKIAGGFLKDAASLQIHRLQKFTLGSFKVNYWIRLISETGTNSVEKLNILSDLNTVREIKYRFNDNSIKKFFAESDSVVKNKIKEILYEKK